EEGMGDTRVVRQARWQLHEQESELVAEAAGLFEKGIQQRHRRVQAVLVRDRLRQLDREAEPIGHAGCPTDIGRLAVGTVEGGVDLDRAETRRVAREHAVAGAEQIAVLACDGPAGDGGSDRRHDRWARHGATGDVGASTRDVSSIAVARAGARERAAPSVLLARRPSRTDLDPGLTARGDTPAMPEGPSIVILREEAARFAGRKVLRVSGNSTQDIARMHNRKVLAVRSWGKHFLLEFAGFSLRIHFLLFGSYRINEGKDTPPRLSLGFSKGEALNFYACSVRFIEGDLDESYDWSGDVMSDDWDAAAARRKLRAGP